MSGNSRINHPFSDITKRFVNSAFSLCDWQENMRLIRCFPALNKHGEHFVFRCVFFRFPEQINAIFVGAFPSVNGGG